MASRGRPTKIDSEAVKLLEEAFKIDATVTEACLHAGISREAYYNRCKVDPDFVDKMERAKAFPAMLAKKTLFKSLLSKDEKVAQKGAEIYLTRRCKEYSTKAEITNNTTLEVLSEEDKNILSDLFDKMAGSDQ